MKTKGLMNNLTRESILSTYQHLFLIKTNICHKEKQSKTTKFVLYSSKLL